MEFQLIFCSRISPDIVSSPPIMRGRIIEVLIIPHKTRCLKRKASERTHIQIINKVASLLQTC